MDREFWVFGYGSLMWDPGFAFVERRIARLEGWQRRFCMWSIHYRGTPEAPGLVLALDRAEGEFCEGIAFRIAAEEAEATHALLQERELISYAYAEAFLPVRLAGGEEVEALAYVINQGHEQYARHLSTEEQAQLIATRAGQRGPNRDYLWNTVDHLRELGIEDPRLEALGARVRELVGQG
ncbi:gamma-glutamylcyclotransferase [Neogemmobacter tilapiae]|uniref:glutathione-specific gamma-glutamylcyclotransferase n=1 Tax=Neogemmobacter tilapiae TaxID=875041 RepID=A0A918WQY0_9RHOB|nr:gamma-glutamylcyclotransferase [Gemmobacter tilapiae]GHC65980.1 gamma-glutamylcyclotransferase [Gemmobacter tilapiae]